MSGDICASTLIWTGWITPGELAALPREEWRSALIGAMEREGVGDARGLRTQLNVQLALTAEIYMHLREGGAHPRDLAASAPADRRELLLAELHDRRGTTVEAMRDCDDRRLLTIAASGRLRERLAPLITGFEAVGNAEPVTYGLADDQGARMDGLRILPLDDGEYLGIYHSRDESVLRLRIAVSSDLVHWARAAELGEHNHQGDIRPMGDGYVVASERDETDQGGHLRFRYYDSLEKLLANEPCYDHNVPRALSRYSEGAPDIRHVETGEPGESVILAGFHYYRRAGLVRKVDRMALGILSGFDRWIPWADDQADGAIGSLGFGGDFGSRHSFRYRGETWFVQEAQQRWKDWSSWRALLGNGRSYIQLEPRTAGGSRSFASPCITPLGGSRYAAALYLPRQGNVPGEDGELLYGFRLDARAPGDAGNSSAP